MKLSEIEYGRKIYTQLGHQVLAVLSRRVDGYSVYVGAVPGENHALEWEEVAKHGDKQIEPVARAIAENLFYLLIDVDYVP